jgi:uncharacterized protein YjiS (DUF1127 family)
MSKFMPGAFRAAMRSYRQRRAHRMTVLDLSAMEDAMLRDIGLTRSNIHAAVEERVARERSMD